MPAPNLDISSITHPMIHIAPKDLSVDFMSAIFGPVVDAIRNSGSAGGAQFTAATAGDSLLGSMMQVMNETMLFLAALYIVYITITHSIRTGEGGPGQASFMGRDFSSLWAPVRIPLAVSALLPYAGGYSFLQLLVLWLALNSVGAADALNRVLIDKFPTSGAVRAYQMDADTRDLVSRLFYSFTCMEAYNKEVALDGRGGKKGDMVVTDYIARAEPIPQEKKEGDVFSITDFGLSVFFGEKSGAEQKEAAENLRHGARVVRNIGIKGVPRYARLCGQYTVMDWGPSIGAELDPAERLVREVQKAQFQAFSRARKELKALAKDMVWNDKPVPYDALNLIALRYRREINRIANGPVMQAMVDQNNNLKKQQELFSEALDRGWLVTGGWYFGVLARHSKIQHALDAIPRVGGDYRNIDGITFATRLGDHARQGMMPHLEKAAAITENMSNNDRDIYDMIEGYNTPEDLPSAIIHRLVGDSKEYPIISISEAGKRILDQAGEITITMVLGYALVSGVKDLYSGWKKSKNDWKQFAKKATKQLYKETLGRVVRFAIAVFLILLIFLPLLIVGAMMAYYIPMVPLLIWLGVAISWLVLLIEAVIACVVWAVSWMHPQGDNPTGRGVQGWLLVLSVMLRPSLMLCGLAAALLTSSAGFLLVNALFAPAFSAIGPLEFSLSGLAGFIMFLVVYVVFAMVNLHTSYALVHIIPDKIMRWLNAGVESIGEFSHDQLGKVAFGAATAGGAQILSGIGGKLDRLGQKMGQKQDGMGQAMSSINKKIDEVRSETSGLRNELSNLRKGIH